MLSACDGCVAITTASYDEVTPLPSVTSTPWVVSTTDVTLVPSRISGSCSATAAT